MAQQSGSTATPLPMGRQVGYGQPAMGPPLQSTPGTTTAADQEKQLMQQMMAIKSSNVFGGGGYIPTPSQAGGNPLGGTTATFNAPRMGDPNFATTMAAMKSAQGNQTGQWTNVGGQMKFQPMDYSKMPGMTQVLR